MANAIPFKADLTTGCPRQFATTDYVQVDGLERRSGSGHIVIGSGLGAAEELKLGSAASDVRVLGDLLIDGGSTISVDETVTGNFQVDGNASLGNNSGDAVTLGGGTSDTVTLSADLTVGANLVGIGSSATDYVSKLWSVKVNTNGPNANAYNLAASGTNAGAYAIGVDPSLTSNATATDLMTMLDQLDSAIGGGSSTGTTNLSWTVNEDGAAGTSENPAVKLKGGDGGTSLVTTSFTQSSTTDLAYFTIDDNGTQISPVIAIGDPTAAASSSLIPVLRFVATNTTPANVTGDLSFTVTAAASSGLLQFTGAGIAAVGLNGMPLRINQNAGDPTAVSGAGFLYTKDDAGDTELYYRDAGGNIVQITQDGSVVGGAADSLQTVYATGNTITVTSANGAVALSNSTASDTTTVLTIDRAPGSSTAGTGLAVTLGANCTGDAVLINQVGTGDALDVQDNGVSVLQVTGAGAVNVTPTSGQNYSLTAAGAGTIAITAAAAVTIDSSGAGISIDAAGVSNFTASAGNITIDSQAGELVLDDQGNSSITLSQAGDRTLDQAAAGEVLNGATSLIGAINRIARGVMEQAIGSAEMAIENGVTITAGDVVAASSTSGRVTQANANAETKMSIIGVALTGGTGDVGGTVLSRFATPGSWVTVSGATFTAGAPVFAPDGTGQPTTTAPSGDGDGVVKLGYATSATQFIFWPGPGFAL